MTDQPCKKVIKQVKKFRTSRISKISAGNFPAPIKLLEGPKAILHFIPLASFSSDRLFDMPELVQQAKSIRPRHPNFNLDGVVYESGGTVQTPAETYMQIFRNGIIESVLAMQDITHDKQIASVCFAESVLSLFVDCLNYSKIINLTPPVVISLTMVDINGYELIDGQTFPRMPIRTIAEDTLSIPETKIESYNVKPLDVLSPILDIFWQAYGKTIVPADLKQRLERQLT